MRKPGKCKSCNINYELVGKTGRHRLVSADLYCLVCGFVGKSIYHGELEGLHGGSLECSFCNNYILYFVDDTIWKDEIYFSDKEFLIREIDYLLIDEQYPHCLYINNKKSIKFPMITEWSSIADLYSKLELFQTFS